MRNSWTFSPPAPWRSSDTEAASGEFPDKAFHCRPRITRPASSTRTSGAQSSNRCFEVGIFLGASSGETREPLPCRNQAGLRHAIDHVFINFDTFDPYLIEGSTAGGIMVQRHFNAIHSSQGRLRLFTRRYHIARAKDGIGIGFRLERCPRKLKPISPEFRIEKHIQIRANTRQEGRV